MPLDLYSHPLASYCHKVLIALYEAGTPFTQIVVDFSDPGSHARFLDLWPVGKIPVLRDHDRDRTIPESSIIIEYLDRHHPGAQPMLPADPDARLTARLWDRFFDLHVHEQMQKIVADTFRPDGGHDPVGVAEARDRLAKAYAMLETRMADTRWAAGDAFSIADCAATPALFYAGIIEPFGDRPALRAYFDRLVDRPSVRRVLVEARPFFQHFPFVDRMPDRFLTLADA